MLLMYVTTQTAPVLAGEYDLKGSIEAAKKVEAELREKGRQAEYDAIMIVAKNYVKAYTKRGYSVSIEQVWQLAIKYYEKKSGETALPDNRKP
jgi:hypothetical protein